MWAGSPPGLLGAHLPDTGGVLLAHAGQGARQVSPGEFLRVMSNALRGITTVSFRIRETQQAPGGRIRVIGEHTFRDPNGVLHRRAVFYLLQPQGARWVIIAADITTG